MSDVGAERSLPETTIAEFLAWPGDDRAKHYELVDGQVRAMSPGSAIHGLIQLTLGSIVRQHLRASGSSCRVLTEPSVQPRLRGEFNIRVPDLGVTCSPIAIGQVIIDRSVHEIVIVQSTRVEVQILRCSDDRIWPDNPETIRKGGTVRLESIGLVCPIEDIYSDTPLV